MKSERQTYNLIPLTYDGWDGDVELFQLYNVEFIDDWGTIKKGTKCDCFALNQLDGIWEIYTGTCEKPDQKGNYKIVQS